MYINLCWQRDCVRPNAALTPIPVTGPSTALTTRLALLRWVVCVSAPRFDVPSEHSGTRRSTIVTLSTVWHVTQVIILDIALSSYRDNWRQREITQIPTKTSFAIQAILIMHKVNTRNHMWILLLFCSDCFSLRALLSFLCRFCYQFVVSSRDFFTSFTSLVYILVFWLS